MLNKRCNQLPCKNAAVSICHGAIVVASGV
jgi:hypothetical protein